MPEPEIWTRLLSISDGELTGKAVLPRLGHFAVLIGLLWALSAAAAEPRVALIIGNSEYLPQGKPLGARCQAMLDRVQAGDALSEADRTYWKANCE